MNRSQNVRTQGMSKREFDLYNLFRRLWTEHVMWTRSFITSTAFGTGDLNAVTNRLLRNPKDFAAAFRPFYGQNVASRFEELLTEHLQIAAQLVNAAKAGNTMAADELRKKWYENADQIAEFLSDINPYWSFNVWQKLLYDHLKMTENEAVQMLTGQYDASVAQYDAIQNEALVMADVMADGIIKQFRV